jgi:redox-sensitive bicupin YhaK (pirin superfamily)
MSWQPTSLPVASAPMASAPMASAEGIGEAIEQMIVPRARDLGGFEVRRALPAVGKQMIGPFIFFDQMGPAEFVIGRGIDVRPHPHIGLATVTYLFEGEVYHRDSLGTSLAIKPGEVNLMTAGRGIVHSERERSQVKQSVHRLFGIQAWAALPKSHEEGAPAFVHFDAHELPRIAGEGKCVRLVMGSAYGARSPVEFPHESLFAEAVLAPGAALPLDPDYEERAIYIASGQVDIAGQHFAEGRLLVFKPSDRISVLALAQTRLVLLGGEPMDGPRHIWWNFVASSRQRIEQAKADWLAKRFALVPGDEREFIPLPRDAG